MCDAVWTPPGEEKPTRFGVIHHFSYPIEGGGEITVGFCPRTWAPACAVTPLFVSVHTSLVRGRWQPHAWKPCWVMPPSSSTRMIPGTPTWLGNTQSTPSMAACCPSLRTQSWWTWRWVPVPSKSRLLTTPTTSPVPVAMDSRKYVVVVVHMHGLRSGPCVVAQVNILDDAGRLNDNVDPRFAGMTRFQVWHSDGQQPCRLAFSPALHPGPNGSSEGARGGGSVPWVGAPRNVYQRVFALWRCSGAHAQAPGAAAVTGCANTASALTCSSCPWRCSGL